MNPTALQKLRVFAPQILAFAVADGLMWFASANPPAAVVFLCAGLLIFAGTTTINKSGNIMVGGWHQYIPGKPRQCPNCASMAAEHAKLLADRDELREALAILEVK